MLVSFMGRKRVEEGTLRLIKAFVDEFPATRPSRLGTCKVEIGEQFLAPERFVVAQVGKCLTNLG